MSSWLSSLLSLSNLLSLGIGILASIIFWAVFTFLLAPRVDFSVYISKRSAENSPNKLQYRFKIRNAHRRNIIDLEIFATIKIKGLRAKHTWTSFSIPISGIEGGYHIPRLHHYKKRGSGLTYDLDIMDMHKTDTSLFPAPIPMKFDDGSLEIEDLLSAKEREHSYIQVAIFGYDELSGTRKLFITNYFYHDIRDGTFDEIGNHWKRANKKPDEDFKQQALAQ
jgi:uncharacterized protein (DUF58 family)